MTGGNYSLTGAFWSIYAVQAPGAPTLRIFLTTTNTAVVALVPLSEMFGYVTDLRSMSQGRAAFTMEFDRYDEVPQSIASDIVDSQSGS